MARICRFLIIHRPRDEHTEATLAINRINSNQEIYNAIYRVNDAEAWVARLESKLERKEEQLRKLARLSSGNKEG